MLCSGSELRAAVTRPMQQHALQQRESLPEEPVGATVWGEGGGGGSTVRYGSHDSEKASPWFSK